MTRTRFLQKHHPPSTKIILLHKFPLIRQPLVGLCFCLPSSQLPFHSLLKPRVGAQTRPIVLLNQSYMSYIINKREGQQDGGYYFTNARQTNGSGPWPCGCYRWPGKTEGWTISLLPMRKCPIQCRNGLRDPSTGGLDGPQEILYRSWQTGRPRTDPWSWWIPKPPEQKGTFHCTYLGGIHVFVIVAG